MKESSERVVIIGGGIGGLATANLLAKKGYRVDLYEKEAQLGGRAGLLVKKGFRFDTGPSWYLMPEVFEHYYELLGESVKKRLDLRRLRPAYRIFYESADPLTITSDLKKDRRTFDAIEPGSGDALERYVAISSQIYRLSIEHFLYTNFAHLSDVLNRTVLKNGAKMLQLGTTSVHRYVSGFVRDQRLQQVLEYPMVFLGSSPFEAPAIYSLMSALDFDSGVYYPMGGMYTIIESLVAIGKEVGVRYHKKAEVKRIVIKDGHATGIQLESGETIEADIIISNSDLHHTETKLVSPAYQSYPASYWKKRKPGPSALLLYIGIKGKLPSLTHHNLLFVKKWRQNFEAIYRTKTLPEKASIYISKTSETDASVAPKGHENIFVLVPLPAGISLSKRQVEQATEHYLDQIKAMTGVDLRHNQVYLQSFGPNDFKSQYYSWQSSMLGQSHILSQSAFFRTKNKSKKVDNLYYVGGNTTPGIGVPMCLISAEMVVKRLSGIKRGGPIKVGEL